MKNGFVVINYNDYETTEKIIKNISDYKTIDEIVIVDNCSTDNSYDELLKLKSKTITINRLHTFQESSHEMHVEIRGITW